MITIFLPLGRYRSKRIRKRLKVRALNFSFSDWVTKVPLLMLTAPNKETDFLVGAMRSVGSLSSGGTHMVILDPCCWKWHSSRLHRSMSSLATRMRRFFKSLLRFLVCAGDDGTRLSQPKLQLVKQSLALAHPKHHFLRLGDMMGQKLPVPEVLRVSELPRRFSQITVHASQLLGPTAAWGVPAFPHPQGR